MPSRIWNAFLPVWLVLTAPSVACAIEWNAVTQFSANKNPNTYWSYSTNALPLLRQRAFCTTPKLAGWSTKQPIPNGIYIVKNKTGAEVDCETIRSPTDHLWMDPESGAITVSWTAPSSGTFLIKGDFLGIDTGEHAHPVTISINGGATLSTATISTYGESAPFKITQALSSGQVINFTVAGGSDYSNLSTGLKAVIRSVQ